MPKIHGMDHTDHHGAFMPTIHGTAMVVSCPKSMEWIAQNGQLRATIFSLNQKNWSDTLKDDLIITDFPNMIPDHYDIIDPSECLP
jgi:hypothetical protein